MSLFQKKFRAALIGSAASLCFVTPALATSFTVPAGTTDTTPKTVQGGDTGTIAATGTLSADTPITWDLTPMNNGGIGINNSGTIQATNGTNGIEATGTYTPPFAGRSLVFQNLTATSLLTAGGDAFHVDTDIGPGIVTVFNSGTIQSTGSGRGLFLYGGASSDVVINNMTGGVIQAAANDAIDLRTSSNFINSGTIQALGAKAVGTTSAIDIGGGQLTNLGSGIIESVQRAITVDDGAGGNAFAAMTISNGGTITGHNGEAILFTSLLSNTFINGASGVVNGSVTMGAGDDSILLNVGSTLNGALDGGGGTDTLQLIGSGDSTFNGGSNIEKLIVTIHGNWTLANTQSYSGGATVNTNAAIIVSGTLNASTTTFQNGSTGTVLAGGSITGATAITLGGAIINNSGTISGTNYGVDAANGGSITSITFNNLTSGSVLQGQLDAFRISTNIGSNSVTVNNSGSILSPGGSGLDFAAAGPNATILINNLPGGAIRSVNHAAILAANNTTINNSGQITASQDQSPNTANGIDFGTGNTGTINNLTGGGIGGADSGVIGDTALTINNDGTIAGSDGDGIRLSTTTGTAIIDNTANGSIRGQTLSVVGDGIKVGNLANITNAGSIGTGGTLNNQAGFAIEIGGGSIVNTASGSIFSNNLAATISVGDTGTTDAVGAVTIDNAGLINGAIVLNSALDNVFTNRATGHVAGTPSLLGPGGAVIMGTGNDTANLYAGSAIDGVLDGGAGNNVLTLNGSGSAALASATAGGVVNFQTLQVLGGTWTLNTPTVWSDSVLVSGNGALVIGAALSTPTLTVDDSSATTVLAGTTVTLGNGIVWDLASAGSTPAALDNRGTITAGSRGIDTSGSGGNDSFTLTNEAGALLTAVSDGFRVDDNIGTGTVLVNNAGTIESTGTGRALSFNAGITNALATIQITNQATGIIRAAGDDAIRPGTGHVTIANSGTIQSTAATGRAINLNTTDLTSLVSFGLANAANATIQSPGDAVRITAANLQANATYAVTVDNSGTIKATGTGANNGQAIDFNDLVAPTGSVTITNRAGGVLQAADADAVRPGNNSTINNFGTISGLSAGGTSNDGIDFQTANTGTVNNMTGGTITGARHGITGDLAQTINNDGAITGQAGAGINLDTTSGTTVINNTVHGVITGNAVTSDGDAIDVDYLVNVHNAGTIRAAGTFAGETNEALAIGGGSVVNSAGGLITSVQRAITVDDSNLGNAFGSVDIDNAGTITGQSGEAIRITSISPNTLENRATGVINGSVAMGGGNDSVMLFAGSSITGTLDGGAGSDTLTLSGPGTATTAGGVNFESLVLNGGNWTLSGTQTYATSTAVAGGTTFGVNGALHTGTLAIANGTTYDVTVSPNGTAAGTIAATSTVAIGGGNVAVTATSGVFANVTHYTLITGASVAGTFNGVTVDQAFLTPTLSYTATEVDLTLTRDMGFLSQFAITPNQKAVAGALDASPINSPLFLGVANLTGAAARAAFDGLSGELHASFGNALIGNTQDMQNAVLGRLVQDPPDEPAALWVRGLGDRRTLDASGGTFGLHASNGGVVAGYDRAAGGDSRLGLAVGYSSADSRIDALASRAHANALDVTLYGETSIADAIRLRAGVGYTDYLGIHTARTVTVPSAQTLIAKYDGNAWQGFAEASYRIPMDKAVLEPVLAVNAIGLSTGAYTETGGSAALSGAAQDQTTAYTTLGLRLSDTFNAAGGQFTPRLLAGWQHAFGDVNSSVLQTFTSTGTSFTIAGAPISRDAAVFDAGFDLTVGSGVKLGLSYMGQFSQRGSANGINASLAWNF